MNTKLFIFLLFAAIAMLAINTKQANYLTLLTPNHQQLNSVIKGEHFPLTIEDASGVQFTLQHNPQRILSATLASDHILADLISPSRLVAVTEYVDQKSMSSVVEHYPKTIQRTLGEIESMLALQPDLVFIASYSNPETVRYLIRSGIAVVRLAEVKSFDDIYNNIQLVAKVTGSESQAQQIIQDLKQRVSQLQSKAKTLSKPRVLYYDLNGYSVGANSLMDESINIAGGINAASEVLPDGENRISEELAISLQPDIIVMNQWVFNQSDNQPQPIDILKSKKAWQNVPAIINNQVYGLPGTWLRSISQHRILGVEALFPLLHPDTTLIKKIDTNKEGYAQARR